MAKRMTCQVDYIQSAVIKVVWIHLSLWTVSLTVVTITTCLLDCRQAL